MASKYNKEELQQIKLNLDRITDRIPNDLSSWVWNTYKEITGSREPQPCTSGCPSAGKLWRKAVDTIREYVK